MEMLVQGLFVSIEDGKTTLDKGWKLNNKLVKNIISHLGKYGVCCLKCKVFIGTQCWDGILVSKRKFF